MCIRDSYHIDIFTVGSDWKGKFDYLNKYCKVVYLDRTEGISSSELRSQRREIRLGLVGTSADLLKFQKESSFVNGVAVEGICTDEPQNEIEEPLRQLPCVTASYQELLEHTDALYILSHPSLHYEQVKTALEAGKHVLCEAPAALSAAQCRELFALAEEKGCVLMEGIKTAYSTAYYRLLLLDVYKRQLLTYPINNRLVSSQFRGGGTLLAQEGSTRGELYADVYKRQSQTW